MSQSAGAPSQTPMPGKKDSPRTIQLTERLDRPERKFGTNLLIP
jgi:hypothetical protein